ncbi:DedA family protein [Salinisphaera sp. SWV1]|uniref:DedA family protein n=1 Tax=Salinisphaera sp. SWV1 TaxID=3454139 RepID=UPI003F84FD28
MSHITSMISQYGPWAVFVIVLVEDFGILLAPGETALVSAALLASQGQLSIVGLLLAAWAGAVLGDNIGYAVGRFGGRRLVLRRGARVGITEQRLARVERFFARYGRVIVVFARFVFGLRQLNGIVAGVGSMPAPMFTLYNAIGAALWVGVWGFGVYWFGKQFRHFIDAAGPIALYVAVGVGVLGAAGYLYWRFKRPASRS